MNTQELDKLILKAVQLRSQIEMYQSDPILVKSYEKSFSQLKMKYGQYLEEILFEIYDEHCADSQVENLESYLSVQGVEVEADDFPGVKAKLQIRTAPLRFVLLNPQATYEEVVWKAA